MTIPITYFRSSSFNTHRMCNQQYFIEYILGYKQKSNKKADKGTIVHKVLEICAVCKKALQDGKTFVDDDIVGKIHTHNYEASYLDEIIDTVYQYYSSAFKDHDWDTRDLRDCRRWVWKALKYNDGMFDPRNRLVVAPEIRFDFELEEDWANYEYVINNKCVAGKLALKGTIDLITEVNQDCYEMIDWKGFPLDTPIPTIDGWSTMKELKVGDTLFDEEGKTTQIIAKSKPSMKACYKILFDDSYEVICDDEHLWLLDSGLICKTVDLKKNDRIFIAKPIQTPHKFLPADPYVLGVYLTSSNNGILEIPTPDLFIFKEIERRGYKIEKNTNQKYGFQTRKIHSGDYLSNIDKRIPKEYLRTSIEQRLDLLYGLMDTNGSINLVRNQAVFTSRNKFLLEGISELLLTLGQRPHQYEEFQIRFRPIDINPFLLKRKQILVDPKWGPGYSCKRRILEVTPVGDMVTQCIKVDSTTNTYLCTKRMIPTHNTGQRRDWATGHTKNEPQLYNDPQLRMYHLAMKYLFPDISTFMITIFFINDGGAYTILLEDKDIEKTLLMIQKRFEYIVETKKPKLSRGWKCSRLCHFGKNTFKNTHIEPKIEERPFEVTRCHDVMTMCEQVKYEIERHGIKWVIDNMQVPGFSTTTYHSPGEID